MVQENRLSTPVVVICGPTASGKSKLAIALARLLDTEIISADSIAIYRELEIGTAKSSARERREIVHHMIDVCDPRDGFSVSDYKEAALPIVEGLIERGKIPIICGGTGFYINSLLYEMSYGHCAANKEIRDKYEKIRREKGNGCLHGILRAIDPETAEKLHENDVFRVIRALEIAEISGRKKSEIFDEKKPRRPFFAFSYELDRAALYAKIDARVDLMFKQGLAEEVMRLKAEGLNPSFQSMMGIGYKEFFEFDDIVGHEGEIAELIKRNSRRYAKRQIVFFKKLDSIEYLTPSSPENDAKIIKEMILK